jgi:hypothetical protein
MNPLRLLPLLLVFLAMTVGGCQTTSEEFASTTSAAATAETSSTAHQTTQPAATVPDGTHFGFIHEVSDGTVVFDPAEWLGGDEAVAAARADGAIGPTEDLPNPFYIRNPVVDSLRLPVAPGAGFTLLVYDDTGAPGAQETVSYGDLLRLWAPENVGDHYYSQTAWDDFGLAMYLTISGGLVTGGMEQYIP